MSRFIYLTLCILFSLQFLFSQTIEVTTKSNLVPKFNLYGGCKIAVNKELIYISSLEKGIYLSNDGGNFFTSLNNFDNWRADFQSKGIGIDENIILLGSNLGLYRSTDFGFTWTNNTSLYNGNQFIFEDENVYCASDQGFYKSTDKGITWIKKTQGLPWEEKETISKIGDNIMLTIRYGGVYYSSDNGDSWINRSEGLPSIYVGRVVGIGNDFYISSDGVMKTTDNGLTWIEFNDGLNGNTGDIRKDGNTLYLITMGNGIYKRDVNDDNWELFVSREVIYQYLSDFYADGLNIYCTDIDNHFYFSSDYGKTWQKNNQYNKDEIDVRCFYQKDSNLWFAGSFNGFIKSTDAGISWLTINPSFYATIYDFTIQNNTMYAATNWNGLYTSTDMGLSWARNGFDNEYVTFVKSIGNDLFVGINNNGIYKSTDNGVSWFPKNNGLTTTNINKVEAMGTNLFASTLDKGVFRSTDNGENWNLVLDLQFATRNFCVIGNTIFVSSENNIYKSSDHGINWEGTNLGSNNYCLLENCGKLYACGSFSVKFSSDMGSSWSTDIIGSPNAFLLSMCSLGSKLYLTTLGRGIYQLINFTGDLGSVEVGKKTEPYPYWVSGYDLNEDITITVPDGFEISTEPFNGYSSSVILKAKQSIIAYKEVYIRFIPSKAKTYNAKIIHTSIDATTKEISVKAIGVAVLPIVSSINPTNITASKATTGGIITSDGGTDIIEKGICFNKTGTPTINDSKIVSGNGTGNFEVKIKGLKANTKYYARAFAVNSAGIAYGDEINFTTGDPELSDLTTSSISSLSLKDAISGGEILDDGGVDIITKGICWNSNGNPTILDSKTNNGSGNETFISNIVDLNPNKKYYVRAYATNSVGTNYGNEISFITPSLVIELNEGWNTISSNVLQQNPITMTSFFNSILDNVILVKNNAGNTFIPSYEIDGINNWDVTQGYQIYMSKSSTLNIFGEIVDPKLTPIVLNHGWNIIAYTRNSNLECETAFSDIIDDGNLLIVKDNAGNVYIPLYGINNIGALKPGQGYQVYVINDDILVFPPN